jgi:hypothetical protein
MRKVERFASGTMLFVLVVLALAGLMLTEEYVGWVTQHSGQGGNIYEIMLDARLPAYLWSGVYGVTVRFPGFTGDTLYEIQNGGTMEANLLFDCLPDDRIN